MKTLYRIYRQATVIDVKNEVNLKSIETDTLEDTVSRAVFDLLRVGYKASYVICPDFYRDALKRISSVLPITSVTDDNAIIVIAEELDTTLNKMIPRAMVRIPPLTNPQLAAEQSKRDYEKTGNHSYSPSDWVETPQMKPIYNVPLAFDEVSRINLIRCNEWHPKGLAEWSMSDWATAMMGEGGELCNVIKKMRRTEQHVESANNIKESNIQWKLMEEIGGTFIYLDLLCQRAGIKLSEAIEYEFNRISRRENMSFFIINGIGWTNCPHPSDQVIQARCEVCGIYFTASRT